MCGEDLMLPAALAKLEHADAAIRGGAREQAAGFVGGPRHDVHGRAVQREVCDFLPLRVLLPPDEDFAVVAGGGEDVAVFGVGLFSGRGIRI